MKMRKLKDHTKRQILALKDLMNQRLEDVHEIKIDFNKKDIKKQETKYLEQHLSECENLSSLYINNKSGSIEKQLWDSITNKFEKLKKLTSIVLNLRAEDLKFLIKMFSNKLQAIRHISSLTLIITDEPKLDIRDVYQFCNIFQLRELSLTLSRDELHRKDFELLISNLRLSTSMTNLPMSKIKINFLKNRINAYEDILVCQQMFEKRCHENKTR